jgi:hypothetical protein
MAGPAARALLLLAVLLRAAGQAQPVAQAAPSPLPPPAPPLLQCAPEAEAAARDRDAAVRRWHAALQVRDKELAPAQHSRANPDTLLRCAFLLLCAARADGAPL